MLVGLLKRGQSIILVDCRHNRLPFFIVTVSMSGWKVNGIQDFPGQGTLES